MILSALFATLIFAIALTQATQGFFSALIMTVLTVCCCAAAVGTHDWVAINLLAPYWHADYAHAIALGAIFGVSLVVLRLAFDQLIRRSCLLPLWMDRAGGGLCGFITGEITVGMMAVCIQMVPFGDGFLGFSRVPVFRPAAAGAEPEKIALDAPHRELWLMPDRFAIAAASVLSGGIFSGERNFFADYPDYVGAAASANSAPLGVSRFAQPKSISFIASEPVQFVYRETPGSERDRVPPVYEPLDSKAGLELRMVRIGLLNAAKDEKKTHTFTLRQFRLVGKSSAGNLYEQYHPVAMQQEDAKQTTNRHVRFLKGRGGDLPVLDQAVIPRDNDDQVEMVFELLKGFEPTYLEYKRGARVAVKFSKGPTPGAQGSSESKPTEAVVDAKPADSKPPSATPPRKSRPGASGGTAAAPSPEGTVPDSGRGGNVRGATALAGKSTFGEDLPLEMKAYRRLQDTQIERSKLVNGHLVGAVDQQASGTDAPVGKFEVPDGKRLLQLHTGFLKARSGLGRALAVAVATVQNYSVIDDKGNGYPIVGKYGVANVGGTRTIEIQYFPEQTQLAGGFGKFDRIKEDHLKGDYELVMLFLVDPGTKIVSFTTGGAATRADDLAGENLVAPR